MNRTNQILAILLILQLLLAGFVYLDPLGDDEEATTGGALLSDYESENVRELVITGEDGDEVRLQRDLEDWVLPDADNFPVNSDEVFALLDSVALLNRNRVITRTASSHARLQVTDDGFNRRMVLKMENGDEYRLYVGTSSGANATHVRVNDETDVFLVSDFAAWQLDTSVTGWIDTAYITLPREQIIRVHVENENGVTELEKGEDEAWMLTDLAGDELFDDTSLSSLLSSSSNVRISEPIGREYDLEPLATITITILEPPEEEAVPDAAETGDEDGQDFSDMLDVGTQRSVTLIIGERIEDEEDGTGYYVAKSSDSDYYVQISLFAGDAFTELARTDFVRERETRIIG